VVGIDPAVRMLEQGWAKVAALGLQQSIALEVGDGCQLAFADGVFDGVISAFCLRNLRDRGLAFSEARRVLGNRGRLVALELTRPRQALLRAGHRLFNSLLVPAAGRLLSRASAYRYLVDSIEAFPEPAVVVEEMAGAGFGTVQAVPMSGGVVTVFEGRAV
jgi:demethylmenaquinone methyltransferase/2-methoxy-6-polyprenyl-1,4-benzoquinol methylase